MGQTETDASNARRSSRGYVRWVALSTVALLSLYTVALLYVSGQIVLGSIVLGSAGLFVYVYGSAQTLSYRYLFPGLAGMGLFVLFPLLFTVWIGFTNYSSRNLLTFERVTDVLREQTYRSGADRLEFQLFRYGDDTYQLQLARERGEPFPAPSIFGDQAAPTTTAAPPDVSSTSIRPGLWVTERFSFTGEGAVTLTATPASSDANTSVEPVSMRGIIQRRRQLDRVRIQFPGGAVLIKTSLRVFSAEARLYLPGPDQSLIDQQTGAVLTPNFDTGFYVDENGRAVTPGFRVTVGFEHFVRIFTDSRFQTPFLRIFVWTIVFAALSVLFTLIVGVLLGELLEWDQLRFRGLYRVLLFLPYAVPGFISILVFKGLFNENSGEINLLLDTVFGIQPSWFTDPMLAKIMLLVVNTWLGYPYIMLLWMGLRKSISKDLYEASALAGAGPFTNFLQITWPLVKKPLTPLLVSSFAFNFNNFVLIALLTGGRPDFPDASVPAGTNDILVSYTYRIAFQDSGQNFGLAAAISTVIFLMVAVLSLVNLRLTKAGESNAH